MATAKQIQPLLFNDLSPEEALGGLIFGEIETELVSLAIALGAKEVEGWSREEEHLSRNIGEPDRSMVKIVRDLIQHGGDPLGTFLCQVRDQDKRRTFPQNAFCSMASMG
jgi:hypothetical protein